MATAPLIAAARRKRAHWKLGAPASAPPSSIGLDGGDGGPIGLTVEIFINSAWTDISPYVYYRDKIRITRGRPDETSQAQPQTATLTINNRDSRFSPRNPIGPYYGQLGRNTPIRISRLNNGIRRYRFYGEVPAWPMNSDITGTDVYVQIQAAGMLRRIQQGSQPLRSPMFRAFTIALSNAEFDEDLAIAVPAAYWPAEDAENSTQISSGLDGGSPMTVSGTPTFANNTDFPGSAALPQLNGSIWTGTVPSATGATANQMRFLLSVPATGETDGVVLARMTTTGTVARVELTYTIASGGTLTMRGYSSTSTLLFTTAGSVTGITGVPTIVLMQLKPGTPGNVNYALICDVLGGGDFISDGGVQSGTLGSPVQITVNPGGHAGVTVIGHVACQTSPDDVDSVNAPAGAWNPESPVIRFTRLAAEQAIPAFARFSTVAPGDETAMGYQTTDTFATLLQQVADTLFLPMYEARDQLSLVMRTRGTMYNQPALLTLDVSQHQLSAPLVPVDDDALTRNDVTVTRTGGSSYQLAQTTGPLSTQPPPAGAGDYQTNYQISLWNDSLLPDQAGWRLRMGTVDEPRYPQISINLRHPTFTGSVDMMNAALVIDIGDRLDVVNAPYPQFPPDPISQIVQGYTETLGIYEHDMTFNCSPQSPWRVGYTDDAVYGHDDTDGSTLARDYRLGTETTLSVATTGAANGSPLWTTSAGDFPFDIAVGGERMTVTNITGASSPQSFTVTRSINGVVKAQTSNTDVRLWQPMFTSV